MKKKIGTIDVYSERSGINVEVKFEPGEMGYGDSVNVLGTLASIVCSNGYSPDMPPAKLGQKYGRFLAHVMAVAATTLDNMVLERVSEDQAVEYAKEFDAAYTSTMQSLQEHEQSTMPCSVRSNKVH